VFKFEPLKFCYFREKKILVPMRDSFIMLSDKQLVPRTVVIRSKKKPRFNPLESSQRL
jgi:hypothetical protein